MQGQLSPLLFILGLALALRLASVASIRDAGFFTPLVTEPKHHDAWATAILQGRAPVHRLLHEAPAYLYVIALIYAPRGSTQRIGGQVPGPRPPVDPAAEPRHDRTGIR